MENNNNSKSNNEFQSQNQCKSIIINNLNIKIYSIEK